MKGKAGFLIYDKLVGQSDGGKQLSGEEVDLGSAEKVQPTGPVAFYVHGILHWLADTLGRELYSD